MKVYITDKIIKRGKVKENPDVLYLFGDNDIRRGLGGQAKEMRGEPNTLGISTKKYPKNEYNAFKRDDDFEENVRIIKNDFNVIIESILTGKYKAIVIPPIGIGLAKLPDNAPRTFKVLQEYFNLIKVIAENYEKIE